MESSFKHVGFNCHIKKAGRLLGHLCGYVDVPSTHPWFGKRYSDEVPLTPDVRDAVVKCSPVDILIQATKENPNDGVSIAIAGNVHGGVTYSEPTADGLWCFGFDTAHYGDSPEEWTLEAVEAETRLFAERLAKLQTDHADGAQAGAKALQTLERVNAYLGGIGPQGAAPDVILRTVLELVSA